MNGIKFHVFPFLQSIQRKCNHQWVINAFKRFFSAYQIKAKTRFKQTHKTLCGVNSDHHRIILYGPNKIKVNLCWTSALTKYLRFPSHSHIFYPFTYSHECSLCAQTEHRIKCDVQYADQNRFYLKPKLSNLRTGITSQGWDLTKITTA